MIEHLLVGIAAREACCVAPNPRSQPTIWVTSDRVEPAAGPAMSASHQKRPSAMKMRSVAKGQSRHFAPLKNSEFFVRRTTAKLVADLPIGA